MNFKKYTPKIFYRNYHFTKALLANIVYRFPSKKVKIIGVTGTKGKTTTANYIYQLLKGSFSVGIISTTGIILGEKTYPLKPHVTTPPPFELQKYISEAVKEQVGWLIIETSSHGFDQNRVWGVNFDIGIITNIEKDHLDYHRSWNEYAMTKAKLLKQLKKNGLAILNKDDKKSYEILTEIAKKLQKKVITYGISDDHANIRAINIDYSRNGSSFTLVSNQGEYEEKLSLKAIGNFNIYNALAAVAVAEHIGISKKIITQRINKLELPPGRMEIIQVKPFLIIVDFAHNVYSLEASLKSLSIIRPQPRSKIISVFGCSGLRDKNRRKMGFISAKYSDLTIITMDDPRNENIENINAEIENWAKQGGALEMTSTLNDNVHYYLKIQERKKALLKALQLASPGDIIYVTGMGDQQTLAFKDKEIPWNDKKEILALLRTGS